MPDLHADQTPGGYPRLRFLVIGAGAMGMYFSARLVQAGHEVILKSRTDTDSSVDILLSTAGGEERISGIKVAGSLDGPVDVDAVLIATKAWQVREALADLQGRLRPATAIVTLQNGVDAPETARSLFPAAPVIASTCVVIVKRTAPWSVQILGGEAVLRAGLFDHVGADTGVIRNIVSALDAGPVTAVMVEDVHRALWKKLALIASYGGVGAISGMPVGITRSNDETFSMVRKAIIECARVAHAEGINFTPADVDEVFAVYAETFDAETTSSMQRDLAANLPSELADQNGAIVQRGRKRGVETPIHTFILHSQLPRERAARSRQ